MTPAWEQGGGLLHGPLLDRAGALPLTIRAILGDVRPRFLAKGRAGRGYRAVARNGRVLLASPVPLEGLTGRQVWLRFQIWHRAILPGDAPEPFGILLCVGNGLARGTPANDDATYRAHLAQRSEEPFDLILEVGGGLGLAFHRQREALAGGNESAALSGSAFRQPERTLTV